MAPDLAHVGGIGAIRQNILGVGVSVIDMEVAVRAVAGWIARREPHYVTLTPAHSVMDAHKDPDLRRILNASGLTTPDGMAIVWLLRLHGHRGVGRVYGPDLMLELCEDGLARGYRHFLFGSEPETIARLTDRLRGLYPGLAIAGWHSPPFGAARPEEKARAIDEVNAAQADIVWVGLGATKQERWMAEHVGKVTAPVLIGVGAAFDYLSSRKPQAPVWMRRSGLEWFFRLAIEPRRLWPRYRQYPLFVLLATAQLLGLKRYPIEP